MVILCKGTKKCEKCKRNFKKSFAFRSLIRTFVNKYTKRNEKLMRHLNILLVACLMALCAQAQNVQHLLNDSIPEVEQKADTLATDTLATDSIKGKADKKKETAYTKLVNIISRCPTR